MSDAIWTPDARRVAESRLSQFAGRVRREYAAPDGDYRALWNWSIERREQFWQAVVDFTDVIHELAVRNVIHGLPVRNTDALANPEALEYFRDLPELAR